MYTIYFIFYQCTNILINLCTLIAYSLMTPHEKKKTKKQQLCFCKILGTISNAIDVFSSFFSCTSSCLECCSWVWRAICRQRVNLSCDTCFWWYGVYYIFLPHPLGQSQRGQGRLLIQWFFLFSFFALVRRRQQKRETEKDNRWKTKQNVCVGLCGRPRKFWKCKEKDDVVNEFCLSFALI